MRSFLMPSRRALLKYGAAAFLSATFPRRALARAGDARSYVDANGVWRWADGREVALFGVNYNLASASAFRFSKQSGQTFQQIIDADFAHFERLGFDGLRLCFWGDWEASTSQGDLVENEHLEVLDLLVEKAGQQGLACLLSPIVTYSALWPDLQSAPAKGFASAFEKSELGTNPAAIAAQCRYLGQLLARVNPRTGHRYAEEPAIVAVEPINEPWHHSSDRSGSIGYIDALRDSVRGAGFDGPVFYNVTQDMAIAPAIQQSGAEGATFAWYPTGLQNGHTIAGNGLLLVDDYPQFDDPSLRTKAKLVYEFDAADTMDSYYYPAMVREFRRGGAQFAAMFAYDPLPIAASNSEFNDHFLSLVYTPAKAISAMIAGLAMHRLPRGWDYGAYPENMQFGDFRVDDRENLSEFTDTTHFYHSNDTDTVPTDAGRLEKLAGCGSSPVVDYDGTGAWFLDKLTPDVWRLEVYPDAIQIENPFVFRRPGRPAVRLARRKRKFTVALPDLGQNFQLRTPSGSAIMDAVGGTISVEPGVYCLTRVASSIDFDHRFYIPESESFATTILHEPPTSLTAGRSWHVRLSVVGPEAPRLVQLHIRNASGMVSVPLRPGRGFEYSGVVPASLVGENTLEYYVAVEDETGRITLDPSGDGSLPGDWDFPKQGGFRVPVLKPGDPLVLFSATRDRENMVVPYSNYVAEPPKFVSDRDGEVVLQFDGASIKDSLHADVPAQFAWNGPVDSQARDLDAYQSVIVDGRSIGEGPGRIMIILIERDGAAWGAEAMLLTARCQAVLQLLSFKLVEAAMLPRDYPMSINPYYLRRPSGAAAADRQPNLGDLQAIQMTLGRRFLGEAKPKVQIHRILFAP